MFTIAVRPMTFRLTELHGSRQTYEKQCIRFDSIKPSSPVAYAFNKIDALIA